eukprot:4174564-Pleurochrysis_carterae.AAC.1
MDQLSAGRVWINSRLDVFGSPLGWTCLDHLSAGRVWINSRLDVFGSTLVWTCLDICSAGPCPPMMNNHWCSHSHVYCRAHTEIGSGHWYCFASM